MKIFAIISNFKKSLQSLLVRPSNNYAVLDGLRAISIIWVICRHTIFFGPAGYIEGVNATTIYEDVGIFYSFWLNGFYGVDCFFVLSGLLISNIIFREIDSTGNLDLKSFYVRRFLRLSPALIAVSLFVYISKVHNYEYIWYNIFYINNFLGLEYSVIPHTWSLSVEEQFYIAFSILMLLIMKSRNILYWILCLAVMAIVIRFFVILYLWEAVGMQLYELDDINSDVTLGYIELIYFRPYTRFGAFLFGVLAMYLYRYKKEYIIRILESDFGTPIVYLSLAIVVYVAFSNFYVPSERPSGIVLFIYHCFVGYFFSGALAIFMLALLMRGHCISVVQSVLSHKSLYPIGQLAYALYLTHPLVIDMVTTPLMKKISEQIWLDRPETFVGWPIISFLVTLLIGLVVSAFVYIVIEKPFMDLRNIILTKSK